ncbi:MAG TPA: outer membrane beta-barrel family protein [Steroidobacteraceae bacterium]|nr:outer membrane beta-barrel family protein [Steroidobacteraceae bacterium]
MTSKRPGVGAQRANPTDRVCSWRGLYALALVAACQVAKAADPPSPSPAPPMESVVVTTQKLPVENRIDRKVYSVTTDVQASFGSVGDVLSAIPSVDVDPDGKVSLRGDSNVLILIDGKPSTQLSGSAAGDNLQSIPANDIERIEVLTTPPAQFKADGAAGVINIITKRKRPAGVAGSLQGSLGSGGRSVVGADAGYGSGRLNASVTAGFRHDYRQRVVDSNVHAPNTPSTQVLDNSSTINERVRRQVPTVGVKAEYALDDRQSVSGSVNWSKRGGLRTYTELNQTSTPSGVLTSSARRISAGHDPETDYDEKLGYSRKLARPGEEIELSLHRSSSHQREHYDYTNDSFIPPAPGYYNNLSFLEDHATSELGLDYSLPFAKTRTLKLGYAFEQDDFRYGNTVNNVDPLTATQTVDPNASHDFKFRQQINAAYASYQATVGNWNWLAGLRAELTHTDAQQLTNNVSSSGSYFRIYPSVHVDRILTDETTLSFGASRRVTRPDPSNLDPYVDPEYTPNLRAGNVNLQPEYTQSYEVGYGFEGRGLSYQLTGYYRRNRDSVTDVTEYLGNGLSLTTKTNLPQNNSAGLEFTTNGHIVSKLAYSLSGNLFYSQIDATALGVPGLKSTTGVNSKLKLDYRPTPADSVQLVVTRTDKRLTPQGYISAINIVNVGYKHQVKADLTGILTLSDAFNGQRYERFESTPTFTSDYVRAVRGRVVYVGLIYSFGSTRKDKQANFEYDQSS